ncbi:MAG: recombinase RecA [Lachnospiraceae bacterium]|jgi:recombination protein RecA|nr:recombinase RecA [Lachnospiraceae bacterium]
MGDNLTKALENITKKHGKGSVLSGDERIEIERIPTGSLGLDIITGGGYPLGRFVEVYAPESSGKTTISIHGMIQAQKKYPNKRVAIIDAEHAFDRNYAEALGLKMDEILIVQPSSGEEGLDIAEELIESGEISMIVIDSIAALTPKKEIDGEIGDSVLGLHARLMSQACRKLTSKANNTKTVVYWTNQLREKIGVMYGSPEVTSGGNAMKFYASIRIDLRKKKGTELDDDGDIVNSKVTAKTVKNKTFPPFRSCEFDITFGKGIDIYSEIVYYGVKYGVIEKAGSWYSYGDVKLGQGSNGVKETLRDNPELTEELENKIKAYYKL